MLDLIINVVQFRSHRPSDANRHAGRDHRITASADRVPTKPKTETARSETGRSILVGLAVPAVVGLAFRAHHGLARDEKRALG